MTDDDDRDLWRRLRPRPGPAGAACPDAGLLGGFLERRLTEGETALMEAHLATCPACLDALSDARAALAAPAEAPAPWLLARLDSLGPRAAGTAIHRRATWLGVAEGLAAAAVVVLAVLAGFAMGRRTFADRSRAADLVASELALDVPGLAPGWLPEPLP